jgi:hypothetical protein
MFNPLNAVLNPICHLLALLETHHILHVSRIRVNIYFVLFMIINFAFLRRFKQCTYFYMQMGFVDAASSLVCCVILFVL